MDEEMGQRRGLKNQRQRKITCMREQEGNWGGGG